MWICLSDTTLDLGSDITERRRRLSSGYDLIPAPSRDRSSRGRICSSHMCLLRQQQNVVLLSFLTNQRQVPFEFRRGLTYSIYNQTESGYLDRRRTA